MRLPRFIRDASSLVIRHIPVSIQSGLNEGIKWSLASSGRGFRSGRFETERLDALASLVRAGDHVWDVGAHKGYVALGLARRLGSDGGVTAFEPSEANLWFLRKHIAWNRARNVRIVPVAVSDHQGTESFGGPGSSITFRLGRGAETVRVDTLSTLAAELSLPTPRLIKIDVEGSEAEVLEGAGPILERAVVLFVSVHDRERHHACVEFLARAGFEIYESDDLRRLSSEQATEWSLDPDLVAFREGDEAGSAVRALPGFRPRS